MSSMGRSSELLLMIRKQTVPVACRVRESGPDRQLVATNASGRSLIIFGSTKGVLMMERNATGLAPKPCSIQTLSNARTSKASLLGSPWSMRRRSLRGELDEQRRNSKRRGPLAGWDFWVSWLKPARRDWGLAC